MNEDKPTLMVVEDDDASRLGLRAAVEHFGFEAVAASSAEEALARLKLAPVDVVLSDVMMGRMSGLDLLRKVRESHPDTVVILVTAFGSIESAVEAMRDGAYDYLTKPVDLDRLELLLQRALSRLSLQRENQRLREQVAGHFTIASIVGHSKQAQDLMHQIEQVAPTHATVLILGESGTGKELVARAIHRNSRRREARMISVNCSALPEGLIESELFGHERGAFTGAHQMRKGRFELANHGTLFLDEIGELSAAVQVKLLRVLEERQMERLGGQSAINLDVRLIAATNRDLEQRIAVGQFREDLYYRLRVVTIRVPPLREHPDDIPPLLEHFIDVFRKEHDRPARGFSHGAIEQLQRYHWPGNVRELRNLVESLVIATQTPEIGLRDLPAAVFDHSPNPTIELPMGKTLAEIERSYLLRSLELLGGNKSQAAQVLGIGKKTLYRRLHEYGMNGGKA